MSKFSQKAYILGKVKSMGIKEIKNESTGKESHILETKMTIMPDNVHFTVSKFLDKNVTGDETKRGQFYQKAKDEFESMMNQFKIAQDEQKPFFVSTNLKPSVVGKGKDQEVIMYDDITSTVDASGTTWFSAKGFVSMVPSEQVEDSDGNIQTILKFKSKDMNITELQPTKIEVTMIIADENETQLTLTSGGDYPKELEVIIKDSEVGKATIGQGYTFILGFEKIEVGETEEEQNAWDDEAKPAFARTILKVKKVLGKVTGYVLEDGYSESDSYLNY